jgi:hypothetical protein
MGPPFICRARKHGQYQNDPARAGGLWPARPASAAGGGAPLVVRGAGRPGLCSACHVPDGTVRGTTRLGPGGGGRADAHGLAVPVGRLCPRAGCAHGRARWLSSISRRRCHRGATPLVSAGVAGERHCAGVKPAQGSDSVKPAQGSDSVKPAQGSKLDSSRGAGLPPAGEQACHQLLVPSFQYTQADTQAHGGGGRAGWLCRRAGCAG